MGKYTTNPPTTEKNNKVVLMTDQTGMESRIFFQGIVTFFLAFSKRFYKNYVLFIVSGKLGP